MTGARVSPFGHPRIEAWSAAPRGFSQPPTSFIGSRRQGIHRWLFVAWKNKDARARYGVLKGRADGEHRSRRLADERPAQGADSRRMRRAEARSLLQNGTEDPDHRRHGLGGRGPATDRCRGRRIASGQLGVRPSLE